jgi:hypothetical protein
MEQLTNRWVRSGLRATAAVVAAVTLAALAACSSGASSAASGASPTTPPSASSTFAMGAPGPCPNPAVVTTGGIGEVHVGQLVTDAEKAYPSVTRNRVSMRFFCEQGVGPRAAFPTSDTLDKILTPAQQRAWKGRLVFVSSSNRDVVVLGVHPGDEETGSTYTYGLPNTLVKKAKAVGAPFRVGVNWWWVVPVDRQFAAEFKMQLDPATGVWKVGEAGWVARGFFTNPNSGQRFWENL